MNRTTVAVLQRRVIRQREIALQKSPLSSGALSSPSSTTATINTVNSLLERHGHGDGVITLNVGGKNFQTLRSTIAQNSVLADHVIRAEMNDEVKREAVFIDRDPKHFGMILSYLRNRADGVCHPSNVTTKLLKFQLPTAATSTNSKSECEATVRQLARSAASFVHLPSDSQTLTEMYFESLHYKIPELSAHICSKQSLARFFQLFGSGNPFQMASSALIAGKRMLALVGALATSLGGWAVIQQAKWKELVNNGVEDSHTEKESGSNVLKSAEAVLSAVLGGERK